MASILDRGHCLFVDNWYSSPPLFRFLRDRSTPTCGMVRKKRAQFPPEFLNRKMTTGEHLQRDVFLLSTFYRPKMVATKKTDRSGNAIMKDHVLADYNLGMGFIDKNDALTTQHTMVRKSNKWTTKVALHLNAHFLYELSSGNNPMKYSDFKLAYIQPYYPSMSNSWVAPVHTWSEATLRRRVQACGATREFDIMNNMAGNLKL